MLTSLSRLDRVAESTILSTRAGIRDAAAVDELREIRQDLQMVEDAKAGNAAGAERLASRLKCIPRILSACNARMGHPLDHHDLADLTQDATVVVLGKLGIYAGRSSLEGWVYRICSLELMNAVRRKRRLPPTVEDAVQRKDESQAEGDDAASERSEEIHWALERIDAVEADVIRAKHFEDLTFDQIGRLVKCPTSTVKARYYRGLEHLERLLSNQRSQS